MHGVERVEDVSYFLDTGLATELRRKHERDLVRTYLATLAEHGAPAPTFEDAWARYRFFLYDAWDAAAITHLWAGLQAPADARRAFSRANAAVEDLEVDGAVATTLARA